jgi:peptidoglycan/LPS O-acetylase OafA/YrhL
MLTSLPPGVAHWTASRGETTTTTMLSFASSMTRRGTLTRHAPDARQASTPYGGRASVRHVLQGRADRRIGGTGGLPYLPGLDGLRALAVIAVLLYHGELSWIPGGFLGVEVFFVISGYLITALLLAQWRQSGRIDVKAFWLGRARRLLPALYLVLVATLAYAVVFLPGEVAGLRGDVLAALGYVTNWYLVLGHESYFEAIGRPSLLKHLWSLAVEEQFYLVWPLVLALGLSIGATRWRRRRVLLVTLAGAAASTLLMAVLYRPEVDPSRIYFGTDTRATGLLVGASLAFVWAPWRAALGAGPCSAAVRRLRLRRVKQRSQLQRRWGWTAPMLLDVAGLAALGGLVLFCLRLGEFQPFLYRGGLASVSLLSAVVIMACAHPYTHLGASVLGRQPLRWIGLRSYGIYLWHWPVFMITRPQLDVPIEGLPLLALRLAATLVLADLSYRYVETPIRRGALGRAWRELREARGFRRRQLSLAWAGVAVSVVAVCAALGVAVSQAQEPERPSYLPSVRAIHTESHPVASRTAEKTAPDAGPPTSAPEGENLTITRRSAAAAAAKQGSEKEGGAAQKRSGSGGATAAAPVGPVSAVGDSVMLGAAGKLEKDIPNLTVIDAEVGMQAYTAVDVLAARRAAGQLGEVVVVHIGNNGVYTAEEFDQTMRELAGVRRVVFVNVNVPRPWEQPNNAVIAEGVQRYPDRAVLVDWYSASVDHPEYFVEDGVHLQIKGQKIYARLIAQQLKSL